MIHALYYHLIQCMEKNETVAIIIDEAENIGIDVIEEVRLLATWRPARQAAPNRACG